MPCNDVKILWFLDQYWDLYMYCVSDKNAKYTLGAEQEQYVDLLNGVIAVNLEQMETFP